MTRQSKRKKMKFPKIFQIILVLIPKVTPHVIDVNTISQQYRPIFPSVKFIWRNPLCCVKLESPFCPVTTVQLTIADGFGEMVGKNLFATFQVSNSAGNLQYPIVSTRTEMELLHSGAE